jgi:hypothetical protein
MHPDEAIGRSDRGPTARGWDLMSGHRETARKRVRVRLPRIPFDAGPRIAACRSLCGDTGRSDCDLSSGQKKNVCRTLPLTQGLVAR